MAGRGHRGLFVSSLLCSGAIVVAGAGAVTSQQCWGWGIYILHSGISGLGFRSHVLCWIPTFPSRTG